MAIALRGVGASAIVDSGDFTPALPAGVVADDVLLLCVTARDNVALSLPAGWTIVEAANNGTLFRSTVAWKIAVAGETAPTVTHTGGSTTIARIVAFSGCATGNPIQVSGTTVSVSSSGVSAPAKQPRNVGSVFVFFAHHNQGSESTYAPTTNPTTWTELFDDAVTGMTRNTAMAAAYGEYFGLGLSSAITCTGTTASISNGTTIVLAPTSGAYSEGASETGAVGSALARARSDASGESASSCIARSTAGARALAQGESTSSARLAGVARGRGTGVGESISWIAKFMSDGPALEFVTAADGMELVSIESGPLLHFADGFEFESRL